MAASLALALVYFPIAILAVPGVVGAATLLASPRARIAFVVFGGLIILQSSSSFDVSKAIYLAGTCASLVGALANYWRNRACAAAQLLRPMLGASAVFLVFLALSLIIARAHGVPTLLWLRDAASYALFAASPLFAFDARSAGSRVVIAALTLAGLLGAASFSLEWLGRRNLSDLEMTRLLLPSGGIAAALFAYAASRILTLEMLRPFWLAVLGFIAGAMWITATRSALVILAAPATISVFGPRPTLAARLRRTLVVAPIVGLIALLFSVAISSVAHVDLSRAAGRLVSVTNPFEILSTPSQNPASAPVADGVGHVEPITSSQSPGPAGLGPPVTTLPPAVAAQTYNERAIQAVLAWQDFLANPVFGTGPGYVYVWKNGFGESLSSFSLDTPLALPAKFGIAGTGTLFVLLLTLGAHIWRAGTATNWAVSEAALLGYASIWIANLPLGLPFGDKGFSFGLLLLIALTLPPQSASRPTEAID
ncbi:MAG: hypothetical protein M3Z54_04295 [Gemmatimonadota bacterium]|nr:hypothetical protein [Gemmatimonadota bacterium]